MKELHVHDWHSECGNCGYGESSWADSPALENKPILRPSSKECPNCKIQFTHIRTMPGYGSETLEEIKL